MLPLPIEKLIEHFSRLPGIGPKTAQRLVFYLLKNDKAKIDGFAQSLINVKNEVQTCAVCGQYASQDVCQNCADPKRDRTKICVVSEMSDISPLEKSGEYHGLYHVLNGLLNPIDDITPDKLNIDKLLKRLTPAVKEIILALNPTVEGEATSIYLTNLLKKHRLTVTKLARGLPQGGDLEYADEVTLANAFKGRTAL